MTATPAAIRHAFAEARRGRGQRHRDIAQSLQISEGELIAAHCTEPPAGWVAFSRLPADAPAVDASPLRACRLRAEWPQIVAALPPLGEVMALTRNEDCVHEKVGVYQGVSGHGPAVGLVLGADIDLRIFYGRWASGFAVVERLPGSGADAPPSLQRSLQFFDAQGTAIHKVFLRSGSDVAAYEALAERFAMPVQQPGLEVVPAVPAAAERADAEVDVEGFRRAWASMRDTHEFFPLLERFGVSRTQALRLAEPGFAEPMDAASAQELLARAAQQGVPIMVFVGNPGMIQIHTGPVHRVEMRGPWLNVLDAGFNLHLREDRIASAWLVRKPTTDGLVHSLELFDAAGETIAMLFGERKPGKAERCDWRELLTSVASSASQRSAVAA